MSAQVHFVSGQTEGRKKAFLEGTIIDLSSKPSLTCWVMLTIIKVFIILFLFCLKERGTPWQFSKQISKLSFQLSVKVFYLLGQIKGGSKTFFGGYKKGVTLWDYSQEHFVVIREEKVYPFVKFKIIPPFLCFSLDTLKNKYCKTGVLY